MQGMNINFPTEHSNKSMDPDPSWHLTAIVSSYFSGL